MKSGHFPNKMCSALNARRKNGAANHNTPAAKKRRKIIGGLKKKKPDQQASSEGVSYDPGLFSLFCDERISTIYCFIYHY